MSTMQRDKGSRGELEFAKLVEDHLGVRLVRQLRQYQRGGYDLAPELEDTSPMAAHLRHYAIEIKRWRTSAKPRLSEWWAQAWTQAEITCRVPVLAYRVDYTRDWRIRMAHADLVEGFERRPDLVWTMEMGSEMWCALVREWMAREVDKC